MPVFALLAVRALPKPTVLPIFNSIQEVLADNVGSVGYRFSSMLLLDHTL